jgi:hypothetical protein
MLTSTGLAVAPVPKGSPCADAAMGTITVSMIATTAAQRWTLLTSRQRLPEAADPVRPLGTLYENR